MEGRVQLQGVRQLLVKVEVRHFVPKRRQCASGSGLGQSRGSRPDFLCSDPYFVLTPGSLVPDPNSIKHE